MPQGGRGMRVGGRVKNFWNCGATGCRCFYSANGALAPIALLKFTVCHVVQDHF